MLDNLAVTLAQTRALGHLSACGTTVTPVTTFAATFPPISPLDGAVAEGADAARCHGGCHARPRREELALSNPRPLGVAAHAAQMSHGVFEAIASVSLSGSLDPPLGTPSLPIRKVDVGVAARRQVGERLLPNQRAGEAIGRKARGKRLGAEKFSLSPGG